MDDPTYLTEAELIENDIIVWNELDDAERLGPPPSPLQSNLDEFHRRCRVRYGK